MVDSSRQRFEPGITPLLMDAIKIQRYLFAYLYPSPIEIGCRNGLAYFEPKSLSEDHVPWMFAFLFVSEFIGLGSIVWFLSFIIFCGKDELPKWVDWNPFETIVFLVLGLGTLIELVAYLGVFLTPAAYTALTGIQIIEQECKIQT